MKQSFCFKEIKQTEINKKLLLLAEQQKDWFSSYSFNSFEVAFDVIFEDNFFVDLFKDFEFKPRILRLLPNSFCDWHVDKERGATVNMLLSCFGESKVLFCEKRKGEVGTFHNLNYEEKTLYLFNTQISHCVFNWSEETRFLFSLEFKKEKDELSYQDLSEYLTRRRDERS